MAIQLPPEAGRNTALASRQGGRTVAFREREEQDNALTLVSVGTLVIWLVCVGVGFWGLRVGYGRVIRSKSVPPPVPVQILNVELSRDPDPTPDDSSPKPALLPAQPPALIVTPFTRAAPAMIQVAEPSPSVAFAVPVRGPTGTEPGIPSAASQDGSFSGNRVGSPAVPEILTFGQGDGRQPPPEYPARALRARQEGVVGLKFNVDPGGMVLNVEVEEPCPWPLLNTAATRVVREKWRFRPGPPRQYRVALHFRLEN